MHCKFRSKSLFFHVLFMPVLLTLAIVSADMTAADTPTGERYEGHKVIRAVPVNQNQVEIIVSLSPDIWSHGIAIGREVDFRLPPELLDDFNRTGIGYEVLIENVQALIDRQNQNLPMGGGWFNDYKSYADHMAYIDTLVDLNPDIASPIEVGDSLEGRAIRGIRIVGNGSNQPAFVIQGCQHAREWVSPMVCQFIADYLVRNYGSDANVTRLVDAVEFIIVPMVNPDGYHFTRPEGGDSRMWRKNRRNNGDGTMGVDLNRNWGMGWGGEGSSGNTSSDIYRGTAPFSEPETTVMSNLILANPQTRVHIDMHSYSQLILQPWAWTADLPADHDTFEMLGSAMQEAILAVHGKSYTHGAAYHILYPASGIAPDWGYGEAGAFGFTFELRDTGQYGFILPPEQIIPNGEEILPAMLFLADWLTRAIEFEFPSPLPDVIAPGTTTPVEVIIMGINGNDLDPDTAQLHWRIGDTGEFASSVLTPMGGDLFEAILPAVPCGQTLQYYFSAEATSGSGNTSPDGAPDDVYAALSIEETTFFDDNFETDKGWTVENIQLEDGAWTRGVPINGQRGDPPADYDDSGQCYVTDNAPGNSDVDGGPTMLISPIIDMAGGSEAIVSYARWFSNDDNDIDRLDVHISNDDGATWVLAESTGNTSGWKTHSFRVADFVTPTDQMRIRFSATDNPNDSVTEAAVDALRITSQHCTGTSIENVVVITGTLLDGTIADLLESDDSYVHTRSGFGVTVADLHNMEMVVSAVTTVDSASTIGLTIESRIDEPAGLAQIRLRNWNTTQFESVGSYSLGNTDNIDTIEGIGATNYVDGSGNIDLSIKHLVFVPFLAFTFESFIDQVEIVVQ